MNHKLSISDADKGFIEFTGGGQSGAFPHGMGEHHMYVVVIFHRPGWLSLRVIGHLKPGLAHWEQLPDICILKTR